MNTRLKKAVATGLLTTVMLVPAAPAMAEGKPVKATPNPLITPETFARLHEKYPHRRQFSYDGMSVLLKKS